MSEDVPAMILERLLRGEQVVLVTAYACDGRDVLEKVMRIAPRAGEVTPRLTHGKITSQAGGSVQLVTDERGLRGRRADLVVIAGRLSRTLPIEAIHALRAEIHWAVR